MRISRAIKKLEDKKDIITENQFVDPNIQLTVNYGKFHGTRILSKEMEAAKLSLMQLHFVQDKPLLLGKKSSWQKKGLETVLGFVNKHAKLNIFTRRAFSSNRERHQYGHNFDTLLNHEIRTLAEIGRGPPVNLLISPKPKFSILRLRPPIFETKPKIIHPKYYKHLKNGLVVGRLACTTSKTKIS